MFAGIGILDLLDNGAVAVSPLLRYPSDLLIALSSFFKGLNQTRSSKQRPSLAC